MSTQSKPDHGRFFYLEHPEFPATPTTSNIDVEPANVWKGGMNILRIWGFWYDGTSTKFQAKEVEWSAVNDFTLTANDKFLYAEIPVREPASSEKSVHKWVMDDSGGGPVLIEATEAQHTAWGGDEGTFLDTGGEKLYMLLARMRLENDVPAIKITHPHDCVWVHPKNAEELADAISEFDGLPNGSTPGDMLVWDGESWVIIPAPVSMTYNPFMMFDLSTNTPVWVEPQVCPPSGGSS